VIGKAGHGGMPHLSVDPIYAAAQVVTALQSLVARETKPGEALVVSIAAIEGGTAVNVVVEEVTLRGTVRWFSEADRQRALERIPAIASGVCSGLRAHPGCFFGEARAALTRPRTITTRSISMIARLLLPPRSSCEPR